MPSALSHAWVLLAFQMLCSVFAGVYNEKLLKKDGKDGRHVLVWVGVRVRVDLGGGRW